MKIVNLSTDDSFVESIPLSEYPRPQFKRDSYLCLNGFWNLAISKSKDIPEKFDYQIRVPYPVESVLSNVQRYLKKGEYLYYQKEFSLEEDFINDILELHFDGIDQCAQVYLNGNLITTHEGGYLPFSVQIQDYLKKVNCLIIRVKDNLDFKYPYGKQAKKSHGMWYSKISGIWKSVWIESYSKNYFKGIKITPSLNDVTFEIDTNIKSKTIIISNGKEEIRRKFSANKVTFKINNPLLWTPENPFLYSFRLIGDSDQIESYFALRTIEIKKHQGINRIMLNDKPYFFHGLLDQGYFPDGIFTPKSYQKYQDDILLAKRLGFNTLRKHIKIEPDYFYFLCDKLGIIVFQDMVNNDKYHFFKETLLPTLGLQRWKNYGKGRNPIIKSNFINHSKETLGLLYNHPSICYYTIFNEGWGQFDTDKMYQLLKKEDQTRIFDTTSGWFNSSLSDVTSKHVYFKKIKVNPSNRPIIISEFGGYVYKNINHCYNLKKTYGYKIYKKISSYQKGLIDLYQTQIIPNIKYGISGAIYTQLSDVEDETNGLITYDRKVIKVNQEEMLKLKDKLKI